MIKKAAIRLEGKIFTERRHADILRDTAVLRDGILISSTGWSAGLRDGDGTFLNRELAAEHALRCGQIKTLKYSKTQLFSEDLY